jgi:RimJ/RimL family protein N-acetyltransferase
VARGDKVVIREKRVEDAPDDYAWRTDEELARLDATRPIRMSFEDFLKFSKEELIYANRTSKRLAIDNLDGRHIGNCMFYDIDYRRARAELGIMIGDREYWDKGYGTDAVDSLLTHIFITTSLQVVYLHTLDWNHRARRSFAKSGFHEVKQVRRSGLDFVLMETDRQTWKRLYHDRGAGPQADQDGRGASDEIAAE